MTKTFTRPGDFCARSDAEAWCKSQGWSVGKMCGPSPRGILKDPDFIIAKWRNLTDGEIRELDGKMTGDMRYGPVTVEIFEKGESS